MALTSSTRVWLTNAAIAGGVGLGLWALLRPSKANAAVLPDDVPTEEGPTFLDGLRIGERVGSGETPPEPPKPKFIGDLKYVPRRSVVVPKTTPEQTPEEKRKAFFDANSQRFVLIGKGTTSQDQYEHAKQIDPGYTSATQFRKAVTADEYNLRLYGSKYAPSGFPLVTLDSAQQSLAMAWYPRHADALMMLVDGTLPTRALNSMGSTGQRPNGSGSSYATLWIPPSDQPVPTGVTYRTLPPEFYP